MGFLVGFLVGLTGVGGAALLTPVLVLIGVHPSIAIGTDLVYNSITKFFGVIQHWRQKTINFSLVKYFSFGSIPSAVIAIMFLHYSNFQNREGLIKETLGYVLIVVSLSMFIRIFFDKYLKSSSIQSKPLEQKLFLTILFGAVFGFIVGLTSIGSGSLFALAMFYFYRLSASEIVGTDIAHAFLLVSVAGILNVSYGNVNFLLVINLLIGSIPGVLLGSSLSAVVPTKPLRVIMAIVILISGLNDAR